MHSQMQDAMCTHPERGDDDIHLDEPQRLNWEISRGVHQSEPLQRQQVALGQEDIHDAYLDLYI